MSAILSRSSDGQLDLHNESVNLSSIHVLHRLVGVLLVFVVNVSVAAVEVHVEAIRRQINVLDDSVDGKDLLEMSSQNVFAEILDDDSLRRTCRTRRRAGSSWRSSPPEASAAIATITTWGRRSATTDRWRWRTTRTVAVAGTTVRTGADWRGAAVRGTGTSAVAAASWTVLTATWRTGAGTGGRARRAGTRWTTSENNFLLPNFRFFAVNSPRRRWSWATRRAAWRRTSSLFFFVYLFGHSARKTILFEWNSNLMENHGKVRNLGEIFG